MVLKIWPHPSCIFSSNIAHLMWVFFQTPFCIRNKLSKFNYFYFCVYFKSKMVKIVKRVNYVLALVTQLFRQRLISISIVRPI